MTTVYVDALAPEVHIGFGDNTYTVDDMARKFDALRRLWSACRETENIGFARWEPNAAVLPQIRCIVASVRMQSPLWMTLLFPGAGAGAGFIAVRLFAQALRDPQAIGGWLPTFVESWHRKWADAERARIQHSEAHRNRLAEIEREINVAVTQMGSAPVSVTVDNLPDADDILALPAPEQ